MKIMQDLDTGQCVTVQLVLSIPEHLYDLMLDAAAECSVSFPEFLAGAAFETSRELLGEDVFPEMNVEFQFNYLSKNKEEIL